MTGERDFIVFNVYSNESASVFLDILVRQKQKR